jgi:pimeloyl-ACP methyl ester carboxylesterase
MYRSCQLSAISYQLAFGFWVVQALYAQGGAQVLTFHSLVDDSEQPYALYLPKAMEAGKRYPLVMSLHGEEANHRVNLRQVFGLPIRSGESDPSDLRQFAGVRDAGFIVACPLARGTMGYEGIAARDVYDVLADVEKRYPVDEDRVYLTGVSMGGAGALRLALTRPDVWAAVAAVCPIAAPEIEELAGNALNEPIRLFHGDQDPIVPVENSRAWQRRLVDAGVAADYIEYPGVRHNAWDIAYRNGAIFAWFEAQRRRRMPERVRLETRSYEHASAYWLRIDGLTPGTLTLADAKRNGAEIAVETKNVDGFTLLLDRAPAAVTIDGATLRARPPASSFVKTAGKWRAGRFAQQGKHAGAEGPIAAAVRGPQIYVYGSAGAATTEELEARRKVAETAASWVSSRSRLSLALPVKADTAVTQEELDSSDVILFGTRETNTLIARLAPRLPMTLAPGAADYGLLFVAPAGRHYALVSSGLPWWTGADETKRGGSPLAPQPYRLLTTFGDYILFKGSLANVVAEGRFDRNWKVPAEAQAKMLATGTVTIP